MIPTAKHILFLLMGFTLLSCSNENEESISNHVVESDNPLPECPSSPNCYRISLRYNIAPDTLLKASEKALVEMGAGDIHVNGQDQEISAVFTIWLFRFRDDVALKVEQKSNQSLLHIRSASRKGYSDLGVNKHRVDQFVRRIESNLGV